ncbi:J domain-containing protein [Pseudactinotalea sp. Z1732]|uniref:J domain-containing protein n=1 Tax=Micrococcales TaxID=85006 RepID=UPI003C7B8B5E
MSDRLMGRSAYEVLGVSAQASDAELKRAYRRMMRQSHPDLGGDPEVFAAVQAAWAQVSSPRLRAVHDQRRRSSPAAGPEPEQRVWAAGTAGRSSASRSAPARARSHGHPGGWSRQQYLTLVREWVGRGVDLTDPYEPALVRRAPREIRHLLADAVAEEATAKALADLGSAFTVWHDVATTRSPRSAAAAGHTKIDHIALGPTGLFAIQSEDWGAPVRPGTRDLHSEGLAERERPMKDLAGRLRAARSWGLHFTALVVVLPDGHLEADTAVVGRSRRLRRMVVRSSAIAALLRTGVPGVPGLEADVLFDWRTRLHRSIHFV